MMPPSLTRSPSPISLAASAVLLLLAVFYVAASGALSRHMILHIALMTGLAPLIVHLFLKRTPARAPVTRGSNLLTATALQLLLFFIWHSPRGMSMAMESLVGQVVMQASLLAAAIWFWYCIMTYPRGNVWPAAVSLLVTGKLFCLVAIVLVFAPGLFSGVGHMAGHGAASLADQQLAGLLMIAACPIAYMMTALALIARWMRSLQAPGTSSTRA